MVALNIDGLVSGLDTSSIISQLMQLERQPQTRLVAKRDAVNKEVDLYRQLNTRFQAVETAAEALSGTLDWSVAKATSSNEAAVGVSASTSAPTSTLAFRVNALAAAHVVSSTGTITSPTQSGVISGSISVGGVNIGSVGDGSLNSVVSAINAAVPGVVAQVVQTGVNAYRLQISAKATGTASAFTVSGGSWGGLGTVNRIVTQGANATLTVGATNTYTVSSASNTITDVVPGVTLTLKQTTAASPLVTVDVSNDPEAVADKVAALVTAVNDANSLIRSNSSYDSTSRTAGLFLGDSNALALSNALVQATTNAVSGGAYSPSAVGISVSQSGVLSFDRSKFLTAYAENPGGVRQLFEANGSGSTTDDGIAERLRLAAASATDLSTGRIQAAIDSRTATTKSLDTQIANWDTRLALRETALKRQFSALESALGRAQNQSSWLAGQIANLPKISSNNS